MACTMMSQRSMCRAPCAAAPRLRPVALIARPSRAALLIARGADAGAAAISEAVEVASETKAVQIVDDAAAFDALLKEAAAANDLVVVDYFTQWCGPCKLIAPQVEVMAASYKGQGVRFAKVDCGKTDENKKWAMTIGIKVLPTFRFYKDGSSTHVDQVTGSKVDVLKAAVEKNRAAA